MWQGQSSASARLSTLLLCTLACADSAAPAGEGSNDRSTNESAVGQSRGTDEPNTPDSAAVAVVAPPPGSDGVPGALPMKETPAESEPGELVPPPAALGPAEFDLIEATVSEMQQAFEAQLLTPRALSERYLARMAAYDDAGPSLNSVLARNPQALADADALGPRCADPAIRGPLCGIPVLLKDNIDLAGLPTSAGSLALRESRPAGDAFLARKLREAGAILIGKATLTEFANFLGNDMPPGYSSLGGYGLNPYDPRPQPGSDGRPVLTTGGSSSGSGIAVSANLVALAVGTETSGSILSPASSNGVVGIKPTLGLISRSGILPLSADQDTAGPIARSVSDAARLLGVLAGFDPADPATQPCNEPGACFSDYTPFLDAEALAGARIAVPPSPAQSRPVMQAAATLLQQRGADLFTVQQLNGPRGVCTSAPLPGNCSSVLLYGFHRDLNVYLASIPGAPVASLAALVAQNQATPGALKYGQSLALAAQALDVSAGSADSQRYQQDRTLDLQQARATLDAIYLGPDGVAGSEDDVDALLFSGNAGAALPAVAGYPSITVPGGFLPPSGAVQSPAPSGVTFSGPRFSEPRLIALAYAFEQASAARRPPASAPALDGDSLRR
jgi:amidase